jgi:integrase/recombinase XerC
MSESLAITLRENAYEAALRNAVALWADATTASTSLRRDELAHDKREAANSFFTFAGKHPSLVTPLDVTEWRRAIEARGLKPATVYARLSRLSSFFEWAMRDPTLGQVINNNPVRLARPKAPKAYQTESSKALDDTQLRTLVNVVRSKAATGDIVAKRDLAILLFLLLTGMRRSEVFGLRGGDLERAEDMLIVRNKVKGGDYVGREVRDPQVQAALYDYLECCGRLRALETNGPLWTRHDRAGKPGAQLTSHAFSHNLKRYALKAGIEKIHVHQTRHTFARMVAEETGSMMETQDALGHRNLSTTRVYVQRISVKRDKHSEHISKKLAG